jgi:hypothetical protein
VKNFQKGFAGLASFFIILLLGVAIVALVVTQPNITKRNGSSDTISSQKSESTPIIIESPFYWGKYNGEAVIVKGDKVYGEDIARDPFRKDFLATSVVAKGPINNLLESYDIFSIKTFDSESLLYTLVSFGEDRPWTSEVYLLTESDNINTKLFTLSSGIYVLPKIMAVSGNRYISFELYKCWGCSGHQPETLLYNLETEVMENIGKVEDFEWQENGAYRYKEFMLQPCPKNEEGFFIPVEGECSTDPDLVYFDREVRPWIEDVF